MPALANNNVGSSCGIVREEGQNVCSFFDLKKSMYDCRTAVDVHSSGARLSVILVVESDARKVGKRKLVTPNRERPRREKNASFE